MTTPAPIHPGRRGTRRRWWTAAISTVPLAVAAGVILGDHIPVEAARTGLVVLSTMLATASAWPYIRDTIARTTQPRLVTWGTWSAITAMTAVASASVGDYPSAVFSLIGTLATGTIVIVGWRVGDRAFGRLDAVCLALAVGGLALWVTLDQPALAVLTTCLVDLIGLVPTALHAWRRPHEETTSTYVLVAAGGACAALAAWGDWGITALAYPIYVAVSLGAVALITLRPNPTAIARTST